MSPSKTPNPAPTTTTFSPQTHYETLLNTAIAKLPITITISPAASFILFATVTSNGILSREIRFGATLSLHLPNSETKTFTTGKEEYKTSAGPQKTVRMLAYFWLVEMMKGKGNVELEMSKDKELIKPGTNYPALAPQYDLGFEMDLNVSGPAVKYELGKLDFE